MLGSARSVLMKSAAAPPSLPSALAAYAFSEGSGLTSADASGNGNTLTLNGTSWTTGHTGSGITNTALTQGASSTLTAPTAALTLMAWIRPLALTSGDTNFALGFLDNGGSTCVGVFTQRGDFGTSNVLQCDLRIGSLIPAHGSALTVGTWVHVAVTYDGSAIRLYQNASLVDTVAASGTITSGDGFYVAGWNTGGVNDTDVDIDDVRVFNSALSGAEVTTAMNTPVT